MFRHIFILLILFCSQSLTSQSAEQVIENLTSDQLKELGSLVGGTEQIFIEENLIKLAEKKFSINDNQINILLGIGGSGPTKRTPANKLIEFMKLTLKEYDCKFFLATGKEEEEQKILNDIILSFKEKCISLDKLSISETLPIIKNCKIAICNDTSFSHLSAALGVPTIVLMCDSPLLYGSYSSKMYPVIPDGMKTVSHNSRGKEKINPVAIKYINRLSDHLFVIARLVNKQNKKDDILWVPGKSRK